MADTDDLIAWHMDQAELARCRELIDWHRAVVDDNTAPETEELVGFADRMLNIYTQDGAFRAVVERLEQHERFHGHGRPLPYEFNIGDRVKLTKHLGDETRIGTINQLSSDRMSVWMVPEPLNSDHIYVYAGGWHFTKL